MSLSKEFAKFVSKPIRKWREFWLLDLSPEQEKQIASRFRTPEEHRQWLEEANEHNRLLKKQYFQQYAKDYILPGIQTTGSSSLSSSSLMNPYSSSVYHKYKFLSSHLQFQPSSSSSYRRGFSDSNRNIFFLFVSGIPLVLSTLYIYYFNLQYPAEKRKKTILGYSLPFIPDNHLQSPAFTSTALLNNDNNNDKKKNPDRVHQTTETIMENSLSSSVSNKNERITSVLQSSSSSVHEQNYLEQKIHVLEKELLSLQQQVAKNFPSPSTEVTTGSSSSEISSRNIMNTTDSTNNRINNDTVNNNTTVSLSSK